MGGRVELTCVWIVKDSVSEKCRIFASETIGRAARLKFLSPIAFRAWTQVVSYRRWFGLTTLQIDLRSITVEALPNAHKQAKLLTSPKTGEVGNVSRKQEKSKVCQKISSGNNKMKIVNGKYAAISR